MDIRIVGAGVAALALTAVLLIGVTGTSSSVSSPATLPELKRVMLSTGGVGYFEYEAQVSGDAQIALPVRMDQIDDVLKSIVVFDDQGGRGYVQLPARAPLSDIFRGLPFGPDALDSNAALMRALKGAEVSVRGPSLEGRIVSVVQEAVRGENNTQTTRNRVGVMTSDGLRQFILEEAESITFTDPVLQEQINQALASVAEHREGQGRTLRIRANGDSSRKVTIAYVVESPLWKSSYRLATGRTPGKLQMQGWAILENVSGTDWNDVDLTVVTGNPVTFRQALYATYYVSRPEIPVEVLGRILPRADEGSIATGELAGGDRDRKARGMPAPPASPPPPPPPAPASVGVTGTRMPRQAMELNAPDMAPAKPLAAESREAAMQVIFHLPNKVTVLNGQSLAVPIVDRPVPGDLVALYQPETHPTHPLAAVRLLNNSGFGLPPGVLTLYEVTMDEKKVPVTSYVGDAQLSTFPDGEARVLAFALDQKVTIDREDKAEQTIANATLADGVFKASMVDQRTTVYTIKGAPKEDRKVVIEHPRDAGWNLLTPDPKGVEMTADRWRIPVDVKAGQTVKFTVTTQWPREETQQLVDIDLDTVLAYAINAKLTDAQRAAFKTMGDMKHVIANIDAQIETEGQARDRVFEDQERIRQNIAAVPAGSAIQQRYLKSMNELEDQAEAHKKAIDKLEQQKAAEEKRLAEYVATLKL